MHIKSGRLILSILFILCLSFQASAWNPMVVVSGSGGGGCYSCTDPVGILWECNDLTVGDTNYSPCGCSSGDSEATNSGAAISTGTCVYDDTSENNGIDYFIFDVSSYDIFDSDAGTLFIRMTVDTAITDTRIFMVYAGAGDYIALGTDGVDDLKGVYRGNAGTVRTVTTTSAYCTAGTEFILRFRWRLTGTPNLELNVYNTSMVEQGTGPTNDNELDEWTDDPGAGEFWVGENRGAITGYKHTVKYYHLYKDWRDSDTLAP